MICRQCPRRCGTYREDSLAVFSTGACHMPSLPVVARSALHFWEEPPLSGTRGAGTIFFSGCSLGCVFCQNHVISHPGVDAKNGEKNLERIGKLVTPQHLRELFQDLIAQGAHNIELVTPTHFTHVLAEVLEDPLPVPVVWNSSGYESVEALQTLEGKVSIYLPDFKYWDPLRAGRYSAAPDYPEVAVAALREMFRQVGPCQFDADGLLQRGVLLRHLLLPGGLADAKAILDFVAAEFPKDSVWVSLMRQYTPMGEVGPGSYPEINRRVRASEYRSAAQYMAALGLPGFLQEADAADTAYVPPFDLTGV